MPTTASRGHPDTRRVLEELHQRLLDAVGALETGEQWQTWLAFASGFHRYSFNNIMLIWSQLPSASLVAGYRAWHAKGRQVRKGEHALRVLAPSIRTEPVLDPDGRPVLETDGTPRRQHRVAGYRPVPVFDISQTDGPPPPQPMRPTLLKGQAPEGLWDGLVNEALQRGYRLVRGSADELGGANGRTYFDRREVWVRHDVDDAQAVKTLAHELGHILLHGDAGRMVPCEGVREVEAESVAYLLVAAHGLPTDDYTFPYVAAWAHTQAEREDVPLSTIVARTGTRVMGAALALIDATIEPAAGDPSVEALGERVGRHVERTEATRDQASSVAAQAHNHDETQTLRAVLADSQEYFQHALEGSWVPDYLDHRGLKAAVASHGVGYAPAGWTILVDHLARLGYRDDHLEAAGIATRTRRGTLIDRFRDRLTIPIHDEHGRLAGFVGRIGPSQAEGPYRPRYLNSPNTSLYVKGDILMGLHRLGQPGAGTPVLCEGPLDAIAIDLAAWRHNRPYVGVATAGTAFTQRQAQQLTAAAGTRTICLAFDSDRAGEHAADAAWHLLTDGGARSITSLALPPGTDPADLTTRHHNDQLMQAVDHADSAAQRICDVKIDASGVEDHCVRRLAAFRTLIDYLPRIPDSERQSFVDHLAHRLQIDRSVVETTLREHAFDRQAPETLPTRDTMNLPANQRREFTPTDPRLQPTTPAGHVPRGAAVRTGSR